MRGKSRGGALRELEMYASAQVVRFEIKGDKGVRFCGGRLKLVLLLQHG